MYMTPHLCTVHTHTHIYIYIGYLGAEIDQNVSGEAIASKVLSKVNGRQVFNQEIKIFRPEN